MALSDNDDQDNTMWDCDYESYLTPESEGGTGPENAATVLGIECYHHYGITLHPYTDGMNVAEEVYRLSRQLWHKPRADNTGVNDDNHTWEVKENPKIGRFSAIVFRKNEKSPPFINIFNVPRYLYEDGPGAKWFEQKYRLVTVGMIAAEIANNKRWYQKYLEDAHKQNYMTVAGRKRMNQFLDWAADRLRLNRVILMRHPQLAYLTENDEKLFIAYRISRASEQRLRYLEAIPANPTTRRAECAAARYADWADGCARRLRGYASNYPNLAPLVPGEVLAA